MDNLFLPARLDDYTFGRASPADLPMLAAWLRKPHVAKWYGDDFDAELAEIAALVAGVPAVVPFIIRRNGDPIGYLQSYDIHGETAHPYADQPPGTIGIDLFIGEVALTGQGCGPRLVNVFVQKLFDAGVPRVVIDPHPGNARAIRAYRKAGFRVVGPRSSVYGDVLLMARDASDLMDPQ